MAKENAKKFMELLSKDEELQKQVKTATENYLGGIEKADGKALFEAVILPIAKEAGYEFSFEDAEELAKVAQDDELSEEEVAAAAGGYGWGDFWYGITQVDTWKDKDLWKSALTFDNYYRDAANAIKDAVKDAFYTH